MRPYIVSVLALSAFLILPQVASAASITTSTVVIDFNNVVDPISSDYVAFYTGCTGGTGGCAFETADILGSVPVGDSSQSITIPTIFGEPTNGIAFLGVYSSGEGLTIGVDSSVVSNYLGKTYSLAFPLSTLTESAAVTCVEALTPTTLTTGVCPVIPSGEEIGFTIGDTGEFVNFSTGAVNGTFTASVVPEPGTLFLFGAGLLGLGAHRRRRNAKIASSLSGV
jgi:hypothetical protein